MSETPISRPDFFGDHERAVTIRPGLEIRYGDFQLSKDRRFPFTTQGDACEFVFVFSGTVVSKFPSEGLEIIIPPQHAALWLVPELEAEHICKADEPIRFVCVRILRSLLANVIRDDLHKLPSRIRLLIEGKETGLHREISVMSPTMQTAARQFFICPYQGTMEAMFFESKALELVSHFMGGLMTPGMGNGQSPALSDKRIQHARHILLENMANPPCLPELGKAVGLSEASLTRGFRKAFGMSVFEFLRDQRLEKARILLRNEDMNVTEIAYAVGFSSPSHLTNQFKKKYALTPREYRKNKSS